jgi:hypothetical protein
MNSIQSVILQLMNGFVTETSFPIDYLKNSDIINAIKKYSWSIKEYDTSGWVTVFKVINFSS